MHYKKISLSIGLLFFLQALCIKASEGFFILSNLPKEMVGIIVSNTSCKGMASLKQVCKSFNQDYSFEQIYPSIIEYEDISLITRGLIYFGHTDQEKIVMHLFNNSKQQEVGNSIEIMGYNTEAIPTSDLMMAYKGIIRKKVFLYRELFKNSLTSLIINKSIFPNEVDNLGYIPLVWASEQKLIPIVECLLMNLDVDISKLGNKINYLDWACRNQYIGIVKLLLIRPDIDVSQTDSDGNLPFIWACREGKKEIIELFLTKSDINVNQVNKEGDTLLYWACSKGHEDIITLLSKKKAYCYTSRFRVLLPMMIGFILFFYFSWIDN
jgi:hypothetical protein